VLGLRRHRSDLETEEMTDNQRPEQPAAGSTGPTGQEPMVPMLSLVACRWCRRRRGAQLVATGRVERVPEVGTCPHGKPLRKVWAEGFGPDADPPPLPGTPQERRQGPV
jgi:hypothetical protein